MTQSIIESAQDKCQLANKLLIVYYDSSLNSKVRAVYKAIEYISIPELITSVKAMEDRYKIVKNISKLD